MRIFMLHENFHYLLSIFLRSSKPHNEKFKISIGNTIYNLSLYFWYCYRNVSNVGTYDL